MTKKGHQLLR